MTRPGPNAVLEPGSTDSTRLGQEHGEPGSLPGHSRPLPVPWPLKWGHCPLSPPSAVDAPTPTSPGGQTQLVSCTHGTRSALVENTTASWGLCELSGGHQTPCVKPPSLMALTPGSRASPLVPLGAAPAVRADHGAEDEQADEQPGQHAAGSAAHEPPLPPQHPPVSPRPDQPESSILSLHAGVPYPIPASKDKFKILKREVQRAWCLIT